VDSGASDEAPSSSIATIADAAVALAASTGTDSKSNDIIANRSKAIVREEDLPVPALRKNAADAFKAQFSDAKSSGDRKNASKEDEDFSIATLSSDRRRIGGLETPIVPRAVSGYDELLDEVEEKRLRAAMAATAAASASASAGLPYGVKWTCRDCNDNPCIPVRSESRCLW
jgi:hypothetical protein